MMDAAPRPIRRLFYAAYIAMCSVKLDVHDAAIRSGFCFDVTAKMRIGIHAMYLTVEVLAQTARPRGGRQHGRQ